MRHERIYVLGLPGKGFLFVKGTTEEEIPLPAFGYNGRRGDMMPKTSNGSHLGIMS